MTAVPSAPALKAVFLHPSDDVAGNLRWPGALPPSAVTDLPAALMAIRTRGYWASAFPEGDGITFRREDGGAYDSDAARADFSACFPFLEIVPLGPDDSLFDLLAQISDTATWSCDYLAPIEGMQLDEHLTIGGTSLHPPVDGDGVRLSDHRWNRLCDFPGADGDPTWAPTDRSSGTTELLAYPLIERKIEVPLALLYGAKASVRGAERLLRFLLEDADHALDPVRYSLCHYGKLQYLPAKPGRLGDMALVYLKPTGRLFDEWLVAAKPYALRVSNNWLGMQVDSSAIGTMTMMLADFVDNVRADEIALDIKSALRALNKAFYLVDLEAAFLHLVYAIDALCQPGDLKGDRQRVWITAFASGARDDRFDALIGPYGDHYDFRNKLVHEGLSFAAMGVKGEDACQFMLHMLSLCIGTFIDQGFANRHDAAVFAFELLGTQSIEAAITRMGPKHFKLPVAADPQFWAHLKT